MRRTRPKTVKRSVEEIKKFLKETPVNIYDALKIGTLLQQHQFDVFDLQIPKANKDGISWREFRRWLYNIEIPLFKIGDIVRVRKEQQINRCEVTQICSIDNIKRGQYYIIKSLHAGTEQRVNEVSLVKD